MASKSALISCDGKRIIIELPLTDPTGKIRVKKKENKFDFGRPIATKQNMIDDKCYIEWQIGYDNAESETPGVVREVSFTARNEYKHAFELSAILYMGLSNRIFPSTALDELIAFANSVSEKDFIEETAKISRSVLGLRA